MPVGKIVKGLDVLYGIYSGYGVTPIFAYLNSTNTKRPPDVPDAATYWAQYPKMDRFRSCKVTRDHTPGTDPNRRKMFDEL